MKSRVCAVFYAFPAEYRIIFPSRTEDPTGNIITGVESLATCAARAAAKLPSGGFATYDRAAKPTTCEYAATIKGYFLGNSTQTSAAVEGTDVSVATQLTPVQTEQYIMEKVYASGECPPTTTYVAGYCTTKMPNLRWGNYFAGRDTNNTIYVLPKSKVNESLCYQCDTPFSIRMTFEGQWFCYSLHPIANPTLATISGNACKNLVPGSAVVKLTDKVIECGFLSNIPNVQTAFLGIYLPAGVKKSATAFKYYDGTSPNPLTWLAGRPNNTIAAYTIVYCDKNQLGRVGDANPISLKNLVCKKPVLKGPCPGPRK
ncbi:hypothetical protein AAVH_24511 [Aphelenchoides avenae]|nr:hypothetical protein AAVH_24511 [Aphelenchus avenae]